jgi:phage terminase large subunit-like protein
MRRSALRAAQSPVELEAFKRFYLNMWLEASEATWLDMTAYDRCGGAPVSVADFAGRRCFVGVDLSSRTDLSAVAVVARDDNDGWIVWARAYCPHDQVRSRSAAGLPYLEWVQSGDLIETPGNVIDQGRILEDVREIARRSRGAQDRV